MRKENKHTRPKIPFAGAKKLGLDNAWSAISTEYRNRYRFCLYRGELSATGKLSVAFIGLYPVRKGMTNRENELNDNDTRYLQWLSYNNALREGEYKYCELFILNLFAYRLDTPTELLGKLNSKWEPVGKLHNDTWISFITAMVDTVIICWGFNGRIDSRSRAVMNILAMSATKKTYSYGWEDNGEPTNLFEPDSLLTKVLYE